MDKENEGQDRGVQGEMLGPVRGEEGTKPVISGRAACQGPRGAAVAVHILLALWVLANVWESRIGRRVCLFNEISEWGGLALGPLAFAIAGWLAGRRRRCGLWIYPALVVVCWFVGPALWGTSRWGTRVFVTFLIRRSLFAWLYYSGNVAVCAMAFILGRRWRRKSAAALEHTGVGP